MKTIIYCGAVAARCAALSAVLCAAVCALPGRAEAQGAFCAEDAHGYRNCGFYTLAQCREALRGMGGTCSPNPAAKPAPEQPQAQSKKRTRPDR